MSNTRKLFESLNCNLDESEVLEEKINKDNAEINEKIRKALRGKRDAKAIEPELAKHGITVDYDKSQGTELKGPNGKVLSDDRNQVYGPSAPGFNNTHSKNRWGDYTIRRQKERMQELNKLKSMDRDDIIRKYNDKTTEEALATHQAEIKDLESKIKANQEEYANDTRRTKAYRKRGHEGDPRTHEYYKDGLSKDWKYKRDKDGYVVHDENGNAIKDVSDADKVDYLTYLTKKPTGYRVKNGEAYNPVEDVGKSIRDYKDLNRSVDRAKSDLDFDTRYYGIKSDEELEKKAEEIRAKAEEDIKKAQADNERHKKYVQGAQEKVDKAEQAKKDFIEQRRKEYAEKKNANQ